MTHAFHNLKNGINERNPGSIDVIVQKIVSKNKGMTLKEVVSMAGWTHSMNANTAGHELFMLLTANVTLQRYKLVIL